MVTWLWWKLPWLKKTYVDGCQAPRAYSFYMDLKHNLCDPLVMLRGENVYYLDLLDNTEQNAIIERILHWGPNKQSLLFYHIL